MTSLSEPEFEAKADLTLQALQRSLDEAEDDLEADLAMGVLTITFEDGTRYVVNSHRAARQIWMAAERSAFHFDFEVDKDAWIATKSGEELGATLGKVLSAKLGRPFSVNTA